MLDSIINYFKDVFHKELPLRLPHVHSVDHKIELMIPCVVPIMSIPPYRLGQVEEDEIITQLKDYLRMVTFTIISLGVCKLF